MTFVLEENFFASLEALKDGDKQFILSGSGNEWFAAIGNMSAHVSIGEAITYSDDAADFIVTGSSAIEVLLNLRYQVKAAYSKGGV